MKQQDNLKTKKIDRLDLRYHVLLLLLPLLLIIFSFQLLTSFSSSSYLATILMCMIYLVGYSLCYYLHQGRLTRLWQHLEHVININDATYELVRLSNQYQDQHAFLNALLQKAVSSINGAEMGSIILVDPKTNELKFDAVVGLDINKLSKVRFSLEETFEYRLTNGKCDRVVVINDMNDINKKSSLSSDEQDILLNASDNPIRSTLSTPIHIDGKLYAMLNLDSTRFGAFSHYDSNLVSILTQEACNAITLFKKNQEIHKLANFDPHTQLCNRQHFEQLLTSWKVKPHLGSFMAIIDMDNLKEINDNLGHQAGDTAIKALAEGLKKYWSDPSLTGRFGGDEFVLLAYGPQQKFKLEVEQLQNQLILDDGIQFSYGVAEYCGDWQNTFKQADTEMYLQKRAKKSTARRVRHTPHLVS
ncbi:MAG: GGDEF domain-containing protein [Shewanella sp.]|nr:GGDEF domain-containing protein [Shewanella sp.]